jgi:hypothetical protein
VVSVTLSAGNRKRTSEPGHDDYLRAHGLRFAPPAALVPAGRLAERFGRRRLFNHLAASSLALAVCGLNPTTDLLIAARALQAIGGAMFVPISLGLVLPEFPLNQRATRRPCSGAPPERSPRLAFVAGALASPFGTGQPAPAQPSVTWRPRAVTLDGKSAERPFAQLMTERADTPPWQRSARSFSAAEIADLLGRSSSAAVGRVPSNGVRPSGRGRPRLTGVMRPR